MVADSSTLPLILRPLDALRGVIRFGLIVVTVGAALAEFAGRRAYYAAAGRPTRLRWLSRLCAQVLRIAGARILICGEIPKTGLIISNHLSYLDILVLSTAARSAFVSKAEVAGWPLFGQCASNADTVFVDRSRRTAVAEVADEMRAILRDGDLLTLFPEGTSTSGESVFPFKPSLLAMVPELGCPVTACALDYRLPSGSAQDEVCYWGDHDFAAHLFNLLTHAGLEVRIAFGPSQVRTGDRKELALRLHDEVESLRATGND